ncbi:PREDICTED: bis(5'-adenosyl)-triphosphatase enpp4-like [Nicrophorus vespilloides]|uniref:Bis(5'-adenosyl)-triphosphatase enpp4-like n=1 Tax=Nicrophorus vespilloides TaxID=110193 RepID=A0ABM1NHL4_NICVS|nr:PREDICTED: bis(5'-adenosyl)-triphosphatase enpp4-like [Nicrophorus vespilloides]
MIYLLVLLQAVLVNLVVSVSQHPVLLIVSYDAFRYNYFDKNGSRYMEKLRKEGTYADYMINVFPTKTFPNHHSIATGLFAESHGVVDNSFHDPKLKEFISIKNEKMWHYNDDILPIWALNERAGNTRYSGSMMWPGASYKYQNKRVTHLKEWEYNYDWHKRVDTVISWIKDPSKPANLVMLYFEEPDSEGHVFGPESDVVFRTIQKLDNITQYLDEQIKANKLKDVVNVVHLSDHGMTTVKTPNLIDITKNLKPNTYEITGGTPCLHIIPNAENLEEAYTNLKKASKDNGHFNVYKKKDLPQKWHFKENRRTPPIFLLADEGYGFQDLLENGKEYAKKYNVEFNENSSFGVHGYDNELPDMHPFFMARGPMIKVAHKVPPFHSVDLYNLFCNILDLKAQPNNGTFANVRDILAATKPSSGLSTLGIAVGAVVAAILFIGCGAAITLFLIKRQQSITTAAALNKRFPQTFSNANIEAQHLLEPEDA